MPLTIASLWVEPPAEVLADPPPALDDAPVHPNAREVDLAALPPRRQRAWRWYVARLLERGLNQAEAEHEAWRLEILGESQARRAGWAYAD